MNFRRLILILVAVISASLVSAQKGLSVYIIGDEAGTHANIHSAPNGEKVYTLPDTCIYMLGVKKPHDGWWVVDGNSIFGMCDYSENDFDFSDKCKTAYIHYSAIGFATRNYGGQRMALYSKPSEKSDEVYAFTDEIVLCPLDVKGMWVYVETRDKHRGWIRLENICDNPLTNCC